MKHNSSGYQNIRIYSWWNGKFLLCTRKKIVHGKNLVASSRGHEERKRWRREIEADDNTSRRRMSSQRRSSPFSLTPLIRGLATIISMFAILHQMELDMPCFCSVGNLRSLRWVDYVFQTRGKPWWKIVVKFIAFLCRFVFLNEALTLWQSIPRRNTWSRCCENFTALSFPP